MDIIFSELQKEFTTEVTKKAKENNTLLCKKETFSSSIF